MNIDPRTWLAGMIASRFAMHQIPSHEFVAAECVAIADAIMVRLAEDDSQAKRHLAAVAQMQPAATVADRIDKLAEAEARKGVQ